MKKYESFCPVRDILAKIGDKWSVLIMHSLQLSGVMRFSELQKGIPDISQKMLTQTLRKLEEMHLVVRTIYPEVPPKVEYRLTQLGQSFMKTMEPILQWAMANKDELGIITKESNYERYDLEDPLFRIFD